MKTLITYIQTGFPESKEEVVNPLAPYWPVRHQLQYSEGLVLFKDRIVIPFTVGEHYSVGPIVHESKC